MGNLLLEEVVYGARQGCDTCGLRGMKCADQELEFRAHIFALGERNCDIWHLPLDGQVIRKLMIIQALFSIVGANR
jgi:hypothetical protein